MTKEQYNNLCKSNLETFIPLEVPKDIDVLEAMKLLTMVCFARGYNSGWWYDMVTGECQLGNRNVPELLCLVHSEISEAMEGYRKDLPDDHLKHRKAFEVELADAIIRIFDLAGGYNLDLAGALVEKLAYNAQRADHKHENRLKEGGKKF